MHLNCSMQCLGLCTVYMRCCREPAAALITAATHNAATTNGGTFSNRGASTATENTGSGGGTASYNFVNSGSGGGNSRSYDRFGGCAIVVHSGFARIVGTCT